MSSTFFTFDHDFGSKSWSHTRANIPVQIASLDVSVEDWGTFWDEAQATAERALIRKELFDVKIMKIKDEFTKDKKYVIMDKDDKEIEKLQNDTKADWNNLARVAEMMFPQVQVWASSFDKKIEHIDDESKKILFKKTLVEWFGLQIQIINQNYEKYAGKRVLFYYDDRRQSWSLRRSPMPKELLDLGVKTKDWFEFYDYATGVRERAVQRHKENEVHNLKIGELISLARGNKYGNTSPNKNGEGDGPPLTRIKKLEQVKKENDENTMKGWGVLQLKVKSTWMGPDKGVSISPILRGKNNECYGVSLHTDPDFKPSPNEFESFVLKEISTPAVAVSVN